MEIRDSMQRQSKRTVTQPTDANRVITMALNATAPAIEPRGPWPTSWIGSNIDFAKGVTAEEADYVEAKYAALVIDGLVDKHSGYPLLEGKRINQNEGDQVWRLTANAVFRYTFESEDDSDPEADIDPLVWQCDKRNGAMKSVNIRRMSKVGPTYHRTLTEDEKARIIARARVGRSTIVLPYRGSVNKAGSKRSNKGQKQITGDTELEVGEQAGIIPHTQGLKRKTDEGDEQSQNEPRKRARTKFAEAPAGDFVWNSQNGEWTLILPREASVQKESSESLLPLATKAIPSALPTPEQRSLSVEDLVDDADEEEINTAAVMEAMRKTAPNTWRNLMEMKEAASNASASRSTSSATSPGIESSDEGTSAARQIEQMRRIAPRTLQLMKEAQAAQAMPTRTSSRRRAAPQRFA